MQLGYPLRQQCIVLLTGLSILCSGTPAIAQNLDLTPDQWQEDLRFLQSTIHQDYPFLFKKISAEAFDQEVEELHDQIPDLQNHEIIVGLARIVASFKYGHTALGLRGLETKYGHFPFNLYQFSDGVYVQGAHKDYGKAVGAKVLKISDMATEEALQAIYPVVPAENEQYFKAYGLNYLRIPEVLHAQNVTAEFSDSVELTLQKAGETFTQMIKASKGHERLPIEYGYLQETEEFADARIKDTTPLYLRHLDRIYYFEHLPDYNAVYVRHSQIQDDSSESIPSFYTRVFDFIEENDVDRLIIDVRLNGGGNNYKNKAVITRIIENKRINTVGNLFVIIGRRTFSACQNLVNELDNYTNAIFIGEPTAENVNFYGDNNRLMLPHSEIPVYLSFAWWQDKPQWEGGPWTAPHIAVDMTFDDYRHNRDPVLDVALSANTDDLILDPMRYLAGLYEAGEMQKLQNESVRLINDPQYRFFDFESAFNDAGYRMLTSGKFEEAIAIFTFATQLFPESPNAWDSLAEGYWKAGNLERAKEYYKKAIDMDPDGPTGKNARAMLGKMEEK